MAVFTDEGKTYHVRVGKGDIGRYVLLPGDPFRTDLIASYFDDAKLVAHNREHKTWTGTLNGVPVSVVSTGMGCPSTAICLEELIACGADTFIRVGTAGRVCDRAFDPTLDGVINTAAVRDEGTTKHYIPIEYPAVADRHVVAALAYTSYYMSRQPPIDRLFSVLLQKGIDLRKRAAAEEAAVGRQRAWMRRAQDKARGGDSAPPIRSRSGRPAGAYQPSPWR